MAGAAAGPVSDQWRVMAHLRELPRCSCGRPATQQLFSGTNDQMGVYCSRCAKGALRRIKEGR